MSLAEQLVRARTRKGFGQDDLAIALGVSRAMVSYWETDKRRPSDRQLATLSQLLRVPIAVLEGFEEPAAVPDLAGMLLRGADKDLPDEVRAGLGDFVAFLDNFADLAEAARFKLHGMTQSPFVSGTGFESADDARRKAEEVRSHLRLGLGPIGDMDAVCEMLGVTVYRSDLGADLSKTVSGAFLNHPDVGFSILVNLAMTPGRRRFTQAHELAHALFHSDSRYLVSTSTKTPREKFADAFAGEFLMPTEGVRRVMEEQSFGPKIEEPAEAIHLQRYYDVSYITALVRLRQMRFLSQARFDEFKEIRPVLFARSLGYEISDEEYSQDPEMWRLERFPPRFRRLVRLAVQQGVISVPTAAAITQLSIDEIADLVVTTTAVSQRGSEERVELKEYEQSGVITVA
jgi:Zn-dependent peptidase ImmA (M78 family)/transcriptional regulator with XRE-family HTH domain